MAGKIPKATELFPQGVQCGPDIVVLDDDEITVQMIDFHLRRSGFDRIHTFTDSQHAIEYLKSRRPDLILTDLYMPRIGGSFLTKLIRTQSHLADVPVLVVTSETSRMTHHKLTRAGALQVITKPFVASDLVDSVRNALRGNDAPELTV